MSRITFSFSVCAVLLCVDPGCAHFIESRVIEQFSTSLDRGDLDGLKSRVSDKFERKTLRLTESLDDFKILKLPEGKTSIVKVEDVSNHEKRVTVKVGESKRRLLYKLMQDAPSKKWVVDDIYMKQKHKGVTAVKSVTEQMDLLLTVREFLTAWKQGGRADVLRVTTPEFGQRLGELPPIYLAQLTKQVAGERSKESKLRPEAQMDQGEAIVRLPRTTGELVISFKLQAGAWKVDDVAVESKGSTEQIPSVSKTALIMTAAIAFLKAYNAHDKGALSRLCTEKFQEILMPADLSSVRLPAAEGPGDDYRVKNQGGHATFVIPGEQCLVNISLKRHEEESHPDAPPRYLVEEVTIYENEQKGKQEKRLSALFTAHAMMQLFAEALSGRNLPMLRRLATPDFNQRVWQRLDETSLDELSLFGLGNAAPNVSAVEYRGAVTRMTVTEGPLTLTYVLRNWNGKLRVDDVLLPATKRPRSLKTTLELMIPIRNFASGIRLSQIAVLERNSSSDLNRLVWKQTEEVPHLGVTVLNHLRAPLTSVKLGTDKTTVKLGDERSGAHVELVKEHDRWVVDDVLLIAGLEPLQRRELKKTLRIELANNFKTKRRPARPETKRDSKEPATLETAEPPALESLAPPPDRAPETTAESPQSKSQSESLRRASAP